MYAKCKYEYPMTVIYECVMNDDIYIKILSTVNTDSENFTFITCLISIHTLQVKFLFSDWLFSKYAECIENVFFTPRTAPRLREVLLVRDRARERLIYFPLGKGVNIFHVYWHFKAILFIIFHEHEQMILFFCRV